MTATDPNRTSTNSGSKSGSSTKKGGRRVSFPRVVFVSLALVAVGAFVHDEAPAKDQTDEVSPPSRTLTRYSYAEILKDEFPELTVNEAIVEGDIDNDGFTDFATILSEVEQSRNVGNQSTPTIRPVRSVLAICHGPFEKSADERTKQNRCIGIRSPMRRWSGKLLYTEWIESLWAPYAPFTGEDCNARGEKSSGTKILMVDETYGHCTVLIFPDGPRNYHECGYCAD